MFSYKIIKEASSGKKVVSDFRFETLNDDIAPPPVIHEGFQPMFAADSGLWLAPGQLPGPVDSTDEVFADGSDTLNPEIAAQSVQSAYENGFTDGLCQYEKNLCEITDVFVDVLCKMNSLREKLIRESEKDLLQLALIVAKQIIKQEITLDRRILAQFVYEATNGITDNEIVICFNPDDYQKVADNRNSFLAGVEEKINVTIKSDQTVSLGGCIVETQSGVVDARIETQLENVFARLMEESGHVGDDPLEPLAGEINVVDQQYGANKYATQQH